MATTRALSAIVVARMDSSRFPGKALADLGGISLAELIFSRVAQVRDLSSIVLSTTARPCDDALAESFASFGGLVFRCPSQWLGDVAARFIAAADSVQAEYALRVNGDSPFPSPELIRRGAGMLASLPDLVTNLSPRTYPYGVSVEWIRVRSLRQMLPRLDASGREHFTTAFYRRSGQYRILSLPTLEPSLVNMRLTIDEPCDLDRMRAVVKALGGARGAREANLQGIITALKTTNEASPASPASLPLLPQASELNLLS
jgi:spore coat polysaccharide biosynthesis protein SpsF (cytidylyltransferase family)